MKLFTRSDNGKENSSGLCKLLIIGITLIGISFGILVMDPYQHFIKSELTLRPGSILFNLWRKPPVDVYINVFIFNVTNADRFAKGLDKKIRVNEVGPYVYKEIVENRDIVFNNNNTLSYSPTRIVKFIRQKSVGNPKDDFLIVPNIPYMGVTSAASNYSDIAAVAIGTLMRKLKSKIMLSVSVHDYLWGYDDDLVHLASKVFPNVINFRKFGILDRMIDEGSNRVTINLPRNVYSYNNGIRDYSIDNWNGLKNLRCWEHTNHSVNTKCNMLQGAYDGMLFPQNIKTDEIFQVYRKAFCRTLPIKYSHSGTIDGIEAFYFELTKNVFDSSNEDPHTACYCPSGICLKKGLGNITPCYYNIPAAISLPHFLNADPSLGWNIDGLNPNKQKHGSEIVIQPQLGIPIKVKTRFQVNILMGDVRLNKVMKPFENTVLPILWLEMEVEGLTPKLKVLLQLLFKVWPYVQMGFLVASMVLGTSLVGCVILLTFWKSVWYKRFKRDYDSIKVLPIISNGEIQSCLNS